MVCYAVVRFGAEWGVLSERRRIGRFPAPEPATRLALMLSLEALAEGHTVELLVQDLGGRLEPYPLPSPSELAATAALEPAPPKIPLRIRASVAAFS